MLVLTSYIYLSRFRDPLLILEVGLLVSPIVCKCAHESHYYRREYFCVSKRFNALVHTTNAVSLARCTCIALLISLETRSVLPFLIVNRPDNADSV